MLLGTSGGQTTFLCYINFSLCTYTGTERNVIASKLWILFQGEGDNIFSADDSKKASLRLRH